MQIFFQSLKEYGGWIGGKCKGSLSTFGKFSIGGAEMVLQKIFGTLYYLRAITEQELKNLNI